MAETVRVVLLAPTCAEQYGVTTRVARYERCLRALGARVTSYAYGDGHIPTPICEIIHIIDVWRFSRALHSQNAAERELVMERLRDREKGVIATVTHLPDDRAYDSLCRVVLEAARAVTVDNRRMSALVSERLGVPKERITTIAQAVDRFSAHELDDFAAYQTELPAAAGRLHEAADSMRNSARRIAFAMGGRAQMILYAGRIEPWRNLEGFIRTVGGLSRQRRDVQGVIVGPLDDPAYAKNTLALAQAWGVAYVGAVNRSDMPLFYRRAAVVFDPGFTADVSASVFEAMAVARPLLLAEGRIGNDVCPERSVCTYETDVEAGAALQYLVDHPEYAESIAHRGRQCVRKVARCHEEASRLYEIYTITRVDGVQSVG
ncbi:MAG: glycosyltransferase family protein [Bacilli bacterium]